MDKNGKEGAQHQTVLKQDYQQKLSICCKKQEKLKENNTSIGQVSLSHQFINHIS